MRLRFRIYIALFFTFVGASIIGWFIYRGIFHEDFINVNYPIDLDYASKVGDFIGGFGGIFFTLVGVVLLYETLTLQRKELQDSRKVFEKQQFENKFFSLINLYQNIINSMHFDEPNSNETFTGKEYFYKSRIDCANYYMAASNNYRSFYKNKQIAINSYKTYYIKNKEVIAHYFRVLYRTFKLIELSNFDVDDKMSYAKIIRAQLSESELFFLNYNSYIDYGSNFKSLIMQYNLTKHLPMLERLEFLEWKTLLSDEKSTSINIVFDEILNFVKSNNDTFYKTYLKSRFVFNLSKTDDAFDIKITRDNNQQFHNFIQDGFGLDDLTNESLEKLLKFWMLEFLLKKHYFAQSFLRNYDINTDSVSIGNNKFLITASIKAKNNFKLKQLINYAKSNFR